jgi:hypothetical protein
LEQSVPLAREAFLDSPAIIADLVRGVEDDLFALGEALHDFGLCFIWMMPTDILFPGPAVTASNLFGSPVPLHRDRHP